MNLNDKNIDQLFRKSAENIKAPEYNDSYWEEMDQLINTDASRRKKLMIWSFFGTLGSAFIVLLLFINLDLSTDENSNISSIQPNSELPLTKEKTKKKKEHTIQSDSSDKNIQTVISESNIHKKNTQSFDKNDIKTNSDSEHTSKTSTNNSSKNSFTKTEMNPTSLTSSSNKKRNRSHKVESDKKKSDLITRSNNEQLTTNIQVNKISTLPIKLISFETGTNVENNIVPLKNLMNRWRISYHLEAAFGVSESYQSNTKSPWRTSLSGIVQFEYNQLVVNTGLGIQLETPANLQITERAKVYGFGLKNYENILNYKSFTQLYIPFEIGYKTNNSTFGMGGQFHSIVSTQMSLTSKVNQEITAQVDFNNQMAGLNRFSGNFYLWIDQQLTDNISAGVRVGSAIGTRIKDSHYFNTVTNEQPIFGQLTLKYQLFR